MLKKEYYVYEWFIVDTLEIFYIGKGKGLRRFEEKHQRNNYFINIVNKYECAVRVYQYGLTQMEAFDLEMERISYWKSLGFAKANLSIGGRGGDTYTYLSEERKLERRLAMTKINNIRWMNASEEDRKAFGQKVSNSIKQNGSLKGEKNPMYGKTHSDEVKLFLSLNRIGRKHKEESKLLMSESRTGEKNHMYGKSIRDMMSKEDFEAYRQRHLEICQSNEFRQKHREIALERYKDKESHPMYGKSGESAVNGRKILMVDSEGSIVREFLTVRLALKFLNIKGHSSLVKAIKNNKLYRGYYWTYKD